MKQLVSLIGLVLLAISLASCATPSEPISTIPSKGYEVSFYVYVGNFVVSAGSGVANSNVPTGLVTVKNTDKILRTFKIEITHYYGGTGYTKEFTLQIEPGQLKTAVMTSNDVPKSAEVGKNYWAGDWGIDYQVTPQ